MFDFKETKRCNKCQQIKSADEFSFSSQTRDGLYPTCKKCWRAYLQGRNKRPDAGWAEKVRISLRRELARGPANWAFLCFKFKANTAMYRKELGRALKDIGAVRVLGQQGAEIVWKLEKEETPPL